MKKILMLCAITGIVILALMKPVKIANAQQDPPRADCCFHIYSVGSNLGWASSLLNYTFVRMRLEPADNTIFENMLRAGQHVEAACKTCSKINPAWLDWSNRQQYLTGQVNAIRQQPDTTTRRSVAGSVASTYQWGQALRVRVLDQQPYEHDTCAEKYFKLGFLLGYAQQTLAIAEERMAQGRNDWSAPISDAHGALRQSLQVLTEYFGLTGCSEIRDLSLQERITNLLNSDPRGLSAINQEMRGIWESLQQRVTQQCDLGVGPIPNAGGPGTGNIVGRWYLSFGGRGGPVGTANENVVQNRGELVIVQRGNGLVGFFRVGSQWEDLLDVSYSNGVLRFTRSPRTYHQFYEGVIVDNKLQGIFRNVSDGLTYRWWGVPR
ncbi:MAG TPA: hypothetical protein VHR36_02755 [Pyrinomonadaceae bacterium]|nr:hypothetical protein [Pyrinomonadaceae bacterium]